jgi:Heterokaryon incompatibility protein (HET)
VVSLDTILYGTAGVSLPLTSPTDDLRTSYPQLGRDVPDTSYLNETLNFLKTSYQTCLKYHKTCLQTSTNLPKRVIDISSSNYHLIEPEYGTKATYAALSYSWGGLDLRITTSSTIHGLRDVIPFDSIPQVFKDAALVARKLGINYLWIDTLCILQDDREDWEIEAAKMADIFRNANITIAASMSPNPKISFLAKRNVEFREIELEFRDPDCFVAFKARRKITLGNHAKISQNMGKDPLDERAWALQERELSTRFLSFTTAELQWKCREMQQCECHQNPHPPRQFLQGYPLVLNNGKRVDVCHSWHKVVQEYTSRKLTMIDDKFPALIGLANAFEKLNGSTYIAGLWKEHLLDDLAWQRDPGSQFAPMSVYVAPTFSWASIVGMANYRLGRHAYSGTRIPHSEILDAHCTVMGNSPYSRLKDGSLTIRGPTLLAKLRSFAPQDATTYELLIGDTVYTPSTDQRTICEFAIDSPLTTFDLTHSAGLHQFSLKRSSHSIIKSFTDIPIKLLSLYSIHHTTYLYENFLILGRAHEEEEVYERLGIGSGKIYEWDGSHRNLPGTVSSFEWLSYLADKGYITLKSQPEVIHII